MLRHTMDEITRLNTLRTKCSDAIKQINQTQHAYRLAYGRESACLREALRFADEVLTEVDLDLKKEEKRR
jgi:hypothetical protein